MHTHSHIIKVVSLMETFILLDMMGLSVHCLSLYVWPCFQWSSSYWLVCAFLVVDPTCIHVCSEQGPTINEGWSKKWGKSDTHTLKPQVRWQMHERHHSWTLEEWAPRATSHWVSEIWDKAVTGMFTIHSAVTEQSIDQCPAKVHWMNLCLVWSTNDLLDFKCMVKLSNSDSHEEHIHGLIIEFFCIRFLHVGWPLVAAAMLALSKWSPKCIFQLTAKLQGNASWAAVHWHCSDHWWLLNALWWAAEKGYSGLFTGINDCFDSIWLRGYMLKTQLKTSGLRGFINGLEKNWWIVNSWGIGNSCVWRIKAEGFGMPLGSLIVSHTCAIWPHDWSKLAENEKMVWNNPNKIYFFLMGGKHFGRKRVPLQHHWVQRVPETQFVWLLENCEMHRCKIYFTSANPMADGAGKTECSYWTWIEWIWIDGAISTASQQSSLVLDLIWFDQKFLKISVCFSM